MPVNHEIKSQLAKLLATEDLIVENKKCETAQFNVHTRVLTLPMWEKASNTVYDLLVGHEVGHALYTPDVDWLKDRKIPPQFVNVVEDVRIEKLMKRRYAGLAKTFYTGYRELSEQDFFSLEGEDVSKMNLADRANLYFKIGNFINVPIVNGEETEIINMIADSQTFDDVLDAAEALYKYCKQSKKQKNINDLQGDQPQDYNPNPNNSASDFSDQEEGENNVDESNESFEDSDVDESNESFEDSDVDESNESFEDSDEGGGEENEPQVTTMDSLEDSIKNLVGNSSYDNIYIEIPKLDLDKIIIPNSEIHSNCKKEWINVPFDDLEFVDRKYSEFKHSAQKEVNYLVKEFECRKAADSYARASVSKTGVLDCSKLHSYKYTEDIFKKVTTLADGKNHGLVFILDWSGSMNDVILDTVKQLFNLIWFCKKVSIPFEVYAFTNDYPLVKYDQDGKAKLRMSSYEKKNGVFHIAEWFSLMNILTSKVNGSTLEVQMKNIFRIAYSFNYYPSFNIPTGMSLSGTPLNESLIALHQILPKFQKENKLQKVQCVILTDGEGHHLKYHCEVNRSWERDSFIGVNSIPYNAYLRDRKTGNTYVLNGFDPTTTLLRNLRDNFVDINFIGIRILGKNVCNFIRRYTLTDNSEYLKAMNSWKKEKAFSIRNSGYHIYFGLSSSSLSQESQFEVSENASKTEIKKSFVKSLNTKKMNKRILSEFIELVV